MAAAAAGAIGAETSLVGNCNCMALARLGVGTLLHPLPFPVGTAPVSRRNRTWRLEGEEGRDEEVVMRFPEGAPPPAAAVTHRPERLARR